MLAKNSKNNDHKPVHHHQIDIKATQNNMNLCTDIKIKKNLRLLKRKWTYFEEKNRNKSIKLSI